MKVNISRSYQLSLLDSANVLIRANGRNYVPLALSTHACRPQLQAVIRNGSKRAIGGESEHYRRGPASSVQTQAKVA